MQNFSEIISGQELAVSAGVSPVDDLAVDLDAKSTGVCPVCGGSGFILRMDGQAEVCRCYAQRRFQQACRAARLQPALQRMTFANFDLANYPGNISVPEAKGRTCYQLAQTALGKTRDCCAAVIAGQNPRGLLLVGQVGSGKTHLAAAAANYLLYCRQRVLFLVVPDFLDELRGAFNGAEDQVRRLQEQAKRVKVLILDDLGSHNFSDWTRGVLFSILNYRMNECLTTMATTNLDIASLQEYLGVRSISRLLSLCEPCLLASDRDIRLKGMEKQ